MKENLATVGAAVLMGLFGFVVADLRNLPSGAVSALFFIGLPGLGAGLLVRGLLQKRQRMVIVGAFVLVGSLWFIDAPFPR